MSKDAREIGVGEQVMVRGYRGRNEVWTPGVVLERLGPLIYHVEVDNSYVEAPRGPP